MDERELWTYSTSWPHPKEISSLTDRQEKVLALLPIIPSLLSIWGSGQIIYMVIISKKKTPYRRILLGLSCCDLFSSLCLPLQPFLIPRETSSRVWAFGNDASCNFLGWAQQFFFSSLWYNGMLSIYFLLTVRYGVKDPQMAKRYEPWMHILSVGFPLVTATYGSAIGLYHELAISQGCWVTDYPDGCGCDPELGEPEDNCCVSHLYGWGFAGLPALIWFLVILGNNLRVYCHVRSTINRGRKNIKSEAVRMSIRQSTLPQRPGRGITRQPSGIDRQTQRIRAVATQAFYYVAAFLVCYVPSFAMRVCEAYGFYPEDEARIFPLLVCQTILLPGQGLLNVFVYVRPAFNKARKDYPNESYFWSFRRAMFGDRVKPEFGQSVGRRASTQFNVGLLSSLQTSMRNLRVPSHNSSMNDSSAEHPPRPSLLSRVPTSSFRNLMAASKQGFASDDDGDTTPSLMGRIRRGLASETKMAYSSGDDSLYSGPRMPRERPPNSILKDEYSEIQDIEKRRVSFAESDSSFSEEQEKETAPKRDDKEAEKASSSDSDSSYSDEKPKLRGMGNSNRMIRLGDINSSFSDCDSEEDKTEEKDDEQEQEHIKDEDGEDDEDSQF